MALTTPAPQVIEDVHGVRRPVLDHAEVRGVPVAVVEVDGRRVEVRHDALDPGEDPAVAHLPCGWERLPRADEGLPADEVRVPLLREHVEVGRRVVERARVRVHKRVQERPVTVDEHLLTEEVLVERVPVGRYVDEPPEVVTDPDGTVIVPVVEEVLVLQRRLLLREEVRIRKQTRREPFTRTVSLREEDAVVEREPVDPEPGDAS